MGDQMSLPHRAGLLRIFEPPEPVGHPTRGDNVGCAIVIDVHRPLAAIGHKFADDLDRAVLMAFPLSALSTGILIPVSSAHKIRPAVSIHVDSGDSLGMIGAQSMDEKSRLGKVSRTVTSNLIELCMGDSQPERDCRAEEDDLSRSLHQRCYHSNVYGLHHCSEPGRFRRRSACSRTAGDSPHRRGGTRRGAFY
jgi:hypothetical protein